MALVRLVFFWSSWHEQAYLLAKGHPPQAQAPLPDVQPWKYSGNRVHPTEKDVSILRPLVESFCPVGGLVTRSRDQAARLSPPHYLAATTSASRLRKNTATLLAAVWMVLAASWDGPRNMPTGFANANPARAFALSQ